MHELSVWYRGWSGSLYSWARTLIEIVLWFWVVSGTIFALRFLAFVLPERKSRSTAPPLASVRIPYPIDRFKGKSRLKSSQD